MRDQPADVSASELLAKWEAEVAPKLHAIAVLRAALGMAPWEGAPANSAGAETRENGRAISTGVIRSDEFFRMSIPDAIKRYLEIMKQPQAPKAIAEGLKAGGVLSEAKRFYANITTALSRMETAGVLVNTKNGWALNEWYAGRGRPAEQPKKGAKKRSKARKAKRGSGKGKAPATAGSRRLLTSGAPSYQEFVSVQRKAGKSLAEAAQAWQAQKAASN